MVSFRIWHPTGVTRDAKREFLKGDLVWEQGRWSHGHAQVVPGTYSIGRHKRGKVLLFFFFFYISPETSGLGPVQSLGFCL